MIDETPLVPPASADDVWLSIITPVLNGAQFIGGCIENVAAQNAPGVEHIIMDGMSTDGTLDIARRFAAINPSIRVISENDGSQAAAMNHGIRLARGRMIGFLNADDFYEPNLLNRVAGLFKDLPEPSFITGNCKVIDAAGNTIVLNRPARFTLLNVIKGREFPYNPSAYFYHKSLHDIAGPYDEEEHFVLDLDFLLRAVQKARVFYFDEPWGNFRWIEGTKSFEDDKAGRMLKRCDALRAKYTSDLSWSERLDLQIFRLLKPLYRGLKQRLSQFTSRA